MPGTHRPFYLVQPSVLHKKKLRSSQELLYSDKGTVVLATTHWAAHAAIGRLDADWLLQKPDARPASDRQAAIHTQQKPIFDQYVPAFR